MHDWLISSIIQLFTLGVERDKWEARDPDHRPHPPRCHPGAVHGDQQHVLIQGRSSIMFFFQGRSSKCSLLS